VRSHYKAREIPLLDFEVNALGTVNLLEATRQNSPEAVLVFLRTNKLYGDAPNEIPLKELEKRYDYARAEDFAGVAENRRIDQTMHSHFGASKPADFVAQEYGRYLKMKVGIFRGGCLTGPSHSGVELHGFLSYLLKVKLSGGQDSVFGYKGKQVRHNIHSHDVVRAIEEFAANPRGADDRAKAGLALRERSAQGRSRLFHFESWEVPEPLSELENYARAGIDSRRNHCLTAWLISADVGKLSLEMVACTGRG
jgi:nucleoside-diphosphate-sugar epimerase